jgi:hypothetical protein
MRQKQDQDKRDLVEAQRSMSSIEAKAQRQYEADQKAAQESLKQRLGEWVSVHAATNLQARPMLRPDTGRTIFALPATWHVACDLYFDNITAQPCPYLTIFSKYMSEPHFRTAARQTIWLRSALRVKLCNMAWSDICLL